MIAYLDSSALVKLVVDEPESAALVRELGHLDELVSNEVAHVEVLRAVRRHGPEHVSAGRRMLAGITLHALAPVLDAAARVEPEGIRSLDAIHLATAMSLGKDLGVLLTYDRRMLEAAEAAGITVLAPA